MSLPYLRCTFTQNSCLVRLSPHNSYVAYQPLGVVAYQPRTDLELQAPFFDATEKVTLHRKEDKEHWHKRDNRSSENILIVHALY